MLRMKTTHWKKGLLILGMLLGTGALALRAACSDACPGSCPMHPGAVIEDCTINYDASGKAKSATCRYTDGCAFTNAGGGGGSTPGSGGGIPTKTIPID